MSCQLPKRWMFLTVLVISLVFVVCSGPELTYALTRNAVLLDVAERNGDSHSDAFSLEHGLIVAGIPFTVYDLSTGVLDDVMNSGMVLVSGRVKSTTFTNDEKAKLEGYVESGGILVIQRLSDNDLFSLFGLSSTTYIDTKTVLDWNITDTDPVWQWFDDPMEQSIIFTTEKSPVNTVVLETDGAVPMAFFDGGETAISKNVYGDGLAIAFGFAWKHFILRNLLNMDGGAARSYSNGFEPATDTIMLFLRSLYQSRFAHAVWKHTSPWSSRASLIMTHDVDSRSGMEMIVQFAEMEKRKRIPATYNVTTHYLKDDRLSAFYSSPYIGEVQKIVTMNQKIGSHSVGHFPDFNDESIVVEGAPGNDENNYRPEWKEALQQAVGATVYGELEVSKDLLERDTGQTVYSFRSGHLAWNKVQINVLDALGYRYDSSRSANDVLTNFPYQCLYDTSFSGDISGIYEIPMTISDVGFDEPDYDAMIESWLSNTQKNVSNPLLRFY